MYRLNISNRAKKDLKHLDKPVIKAIVAIVAILDDIVENPYAGESLHGIWRI